MEVAALAYFFAQHTPLTSFNKKLCLARGFASVWLRSCLRPVFSITCFLSALVVPRTRISCLISVPLFLECIFLIRLIVWVTAFFIVADHFCRFLFEELSCELSWCSWLCSISGFAFFLLLRYFLFLPGN